MAGLGLYVFADGIAAIAETDEQARVMLRKAFDFSPAILGLIESGPIESYLEPGIVVTWRQSRNSLFPADTNLDARPEVRQSKPVLPKVSTSRDDHGLQRASI